MWLVLVVAGRVCGQQPEVCDQDTQASQKEENPARDQDPAGGVGFSGTSWASQGAQCGETINC